jgi:RimJ/RimL family protein N-acetyltransferase
VECLVENTSTCIPWLWIVIDDVSRVFGLVSLTDIIPGRHAYLHGVSDPVIRRHAIIQEIAERAIHTAFQQLRVAKIKIEIESSNRAAKGFCLRMGFTREACFKRDNRLRGEWQDVLVYSLFQKCYSSCPADI